MSAHTTVQPADTGMIDRGSEPVQRILDAAEACFRESGYAAASMRGIAGSAEVSKSLLHYHFQSKEHLFGEVLLGIYERLAARIARGAEEHRTAEERAYFALDALFESLRENPDFQAQGRVWASSVTNETLLGHARRMREQLRGEIIRVLALVLGPDAERLPVGLDAAADLLWAVVTGLGLQAVSDGDEARVERAFHGLRHIIGLALAALARRGDADPGA